MGASTHKTYKIRQSVQPLSPVSPLESNGEGWKYPPIANHLQGQGTFSKVPLEELRNKKRLSRPFEQPYPISTPGQRQVSTRPMQANMKRADSYVGQKQTRVPTRKPAPPTLTIPAPTHQARHHPHQNPDQESQTSAERPDHRQKRETRVQRSTRHQGWDPLKKSRPERTPDANNKSRDLERQDETWTYSKPRGWKSADDSGDRMFFWFLVIVLVVGIVVVAATVHWKKG